VPTDRYWEDLFPNLAAGGISATQNIYNNYWIRRNETSTLELLDLLGAITGIKSDISNIAKLPRVDILSAYADMSSDLIDASVARREKGIIIKPPWRPQRAPRRKESWLSEAAAL